MHTAHTERPGLAAGLAPHVGVAAADELAAVAVKRALRPDEPLYEQGDERGPALYVVTDGLLLVQRRLRQGPEHLLAVLGPGDLAGEVGALDPAPRATRVVALVASQVASVARPDLADWLSRHPPATQWLLGALARRVRRAERELSDLVGLDSASRLAGVLLDLAGHGSREQDGVLLDPSITQATLARLAGSSRETTNKTLRLFAARGLVVLGRRRLLVSAPERLRDLLLAGRQRTAGRSRPFGGR